MVGHTSADLLMGRVALAYCYQGKLLHWVYHFGSKSVVDIYQNTTKVSNNMPVQCERLCVACVINQTGCNGGCAMSLSAEQVPSLPRTVSVVGRMNKELLLPAVIEIC